MFQKVNEANEVLTNPAKRRSYEYTTRTYKASTTRSGTYHEVPRHAGLMGTHIVVAMMTARTKTCNHQAMYSSVHEGSERVESQVK